MTIKEIREALSPLLVSENPEVRQLAKLVDSLACQIPAPAVETEDNSPVVLCATGIVYHVSPHSSDDGFPVYEDTAGMMYVHFPKSGNYSAYVCPVLWDGERCPYKKNIGGYRYFQSNHFHLKSVSLGEKIEIEYVRLTSISLSDYLEIESNPAFAIAKNLSRLDSVNSLDRRIRVVHQCVEKVSKDLVTCEKEVKRLRRYLVNFWHSYTAFVGALQKVFNRKKWRKRFTGAWHGFFSPVETDVFDDDDVPF